jgi:beta-galactosidase
MQRISRRELISSGLAFTTSYLTTHPAWSQAIEPLGQTLDVANIQPEPAWAPREQFLFDFGWKFILGDGNDPTKDLGYRGRRVWIEV